MAPCRYCGLVVDDDGAEKVTASFRVGVVCEECFVEDPLRVFVHTMIHDAGVVG